MLVFDHFHGVNTLAVVLAAGAIALAVARMALSFFDNLRMLRQRAPATRSPTRSPGCRTGARSWTTSRGRSRPAGRYARQTLGLYDLDGFKRYNDAYGHPAGDALLQRLSSELADVVAGHGQAYRLGGDEFCLLLDADGSDAVLRAAAAALEARGDGFDVTASYGRVALPEDAADSEEALHLADRRMYAAKESRPSSAGLQTRSVLLKVLSEREPELHEHSTDVMGLARGVARRLGLPPDEREIVARAAELHDIGKMAIPDAILSKPGPLDEREWRFMRRHTIIGEDILNAAPALQPVAALVRASHERWDGSGYPDGTAGEDIPEGARIVAVCDAFSAMVQERPYQPGLTVQRGGRARSSAARASTSTRGSSRRSRPRSAPRPCPREARPRAALVAARAASGSRPRRRGALRATSRSPTRAAGSAAPAACCASRAAAPPRCWPGARR